MLPIKKKPDDIKDTCTCTFSFNRERKRLYGCSCMGTTYTNKRERERERERDINTYNMWSRVILSTKDSMYNGMVAKPLNNTVYMSTCTCTCTQKYNQPHTHSALQLNDNNCAHNRRHTLSNRMTD